MATPNVMLLAAGRSTRLGALGASLPKPLVPICGYPAIAFGLEACRRAGYGAVVVNAFHRAELLRAALGVTVRFSEEAELLGTGGGIANARRLFGPGPVLVMNAKVVADVDLRAVLAAHAASGAEATMVLRAVPDPRRWGAVTVDDAGRVVGILDARAPVPPTGGVAEKMFTGIHVIEPSLLDRLPAGVSDIVRDAYIPALVEGARIFAVDLPGYFAEHSTPERYLEGNLTLLRDPSLVPYPPGPLVGVDPAAVIATSARIHHPVRVARGAVVGERAEIGPGVVVCENAAVAPDTHLVDTVVWPGATAAGQVRSAVVTPSGVVSIR